MFKFKPNKKFLKKFKILLNTNLNLILNKTFPDPRTVVSSPVNKNPSVLPVAKVATNVIADNDSNKINITFFKTIKSILSQSGILEASMAETYLSEIFEFFFCEVYDTLSQLNEKSQDYACITSIFNYKVDNIFNQINFNNL